MRERVLDAAEEMVQERGLAAVSVQQLADAVGLSNASVFHHVPNKQAVAEALAMHEEQERLARPSPRVTTRGAASAFAAS